MSLTKEYIIEGATIMGNFYNRSQYAFMQGNLATKNRKIFTLTF